MGIGNVDLLSYDGHRGGSTLGGTLENDIGNNGDVEWLSFVGHGGVGTLDNGIDPLSVVVDGLLDVDGNDESITGDVDLLSFVGHGGGGTSGGILDGNLED